MVIVLSPNFLFVITYVAVVVATLCGAIVDANTVQVVGHVLQARVLSLKNVLVSDNLLLQ